MDGKPEEHYRGSSFSQDTSSTHPDSPWGQFLAKSPLGSVVERFIDAPRNPSQPMRCLQNLLYLFRLGGSRSSRRDLTFMKALASYHKHLLALLEEWWSNPYNNETQDVTKAYIFALALASERKRDNIRELRRIEELTPPCDMKYLKLAQQSLDDQEGLIYTAIEKADHTIALYPFSPIPISGSYNGSLFSLFLGEIGPSPILDANLLDFTRADASMRAVALRIGRVCLQQVQAYAGTDKHPLQNQQLSLPRKKSFLRDCPEPIPVTVDPCYWLREDGFQSITAVNSKSSLPHFLWDIEGRKTVPVSEIAGSEIVYAIVSHTWGRWREEGRSIAVQGVPWLVPSITLYDIEDLPRVLSEAGFRESYLWIDLFCIPQEETVDWQVRICREELPRQAIIFKNARTAVAWFHDIEDWRATQSALSWIAISVLKHSGSLQSIWGGDLERVLDTLRVTASKPCGFLQDTGDNKDDINQGISRWFSSLWTLQELIMRPDMLLLNRHWEPLTLGDSLAITLENIAALLMLEMFYREAWTGSVDEYPAGSREISTFMDETGLFNLFCTNRLTAFILGRDRICTHSRAAAIMSVTGATDWFHDRTLEQFRSGDATETLVCGVYPLAFVNEVYKKIGGTFFTCPVKAATTFITNVDGEDRLHISPGTMLPFMPVHEQQRGFAVMNNAVLSELPDHRSVSKWKIQADGSVFIPAASIVASNRGINTAQLDRKCSIIGNDPNDRREIVAIVKTGVDLQESVNEFQEEAHAICVMCSSSKLKGIIIQKVGGEGSFVRACTFETTRTRDDLSYKIPDEVSVNWVVL
ncbi:hypothetical protein FHL15_006305 [Xylaria flabelliformis]|uniref:Heterokaryon incompatibility domain-containing protein n=1 Tax=Xylaria flabelliformis TaxID=2512241 RepID=A0A553HY82_9PEZI|nr:hypothetical protein FHL15_006305 [Xylaria flabelliformis]